MYGEKNTRGNGTKLFGYNTVKKNSYTSVKLCDKL